jgi:glycosyltransferase involved in cell wall biosynthesis
VGNLRQALEKNFNVVNAGSPSSRGIVDVLRYVRRIDLIYLNWIEDLPGKHMGISQTFFFLGMLRIFRLLKIKIVWTLHNKRSHFRNRIKLRRLLFNQMLKRSDLIITHASEGLNLIPAGVASAYLPHPIRRIQCPSVAENDPSFDIIIWGSISPYKGIDLFISYLEEAGAIDRFKILIAGKITTPELREKIYGFATVYPQITLMDEFVPEQELMKLINRSRLVLITYQSESVLSSGVLMDSFSQLVPIVGPHTGAFKDLAAVGLIDTFQDYPELLQKLENKLGASGNENTTTEKMKQFMEEHSWDHFSNDLHTLIERISD